MINIQENILLAPYTTFKIGGPAKYFCEAKTTEEAQEAVLWAKEKNLPFFVLGGGSNLLVSDEGFRGLIIKIQNSKFKIQNDNSKFKIINAEAGVLLSKLVVEAAKSDLTGLEWAVGIPGTIGGAVCGNAGAYGHSISENVIGGHAINSDGEIVGFDKDFCDFCYRGSIFKNSGELVIVEVTFKLAQGDVNKIKEEMRKIITERAGKIPPYPSAGSFFKNYVVEKENDPLLQKFPEMAEKARAGKIAAAYFIEQCGLKGKAIGGAQISEKHANFIVNTGNAKAADVLALVKVCKTKVKEKFGIEIEEETRLLGF